MQLSYGLILRHVSNRLRRGKAPRLAVLILAAALLGQTAPPLALAQAEHVDAPIAEETFGFNDFVAGRDTLAQEDASADLADPKQDLDLAGRYLGDPDAAQTAEQEPIFVPGRLVVKYRSGEGGQPVAAKQERLEQIYGLEAATYEKALDVHTFDIAPSATSSRPPASSPTSPKSSTPIRCMSIASRPSRTTRPIATESSIM
jgi:hypothetical protein